MGLLEPGTYIRTHRGMAMIADVDWVREKYRMEIDNGLPVDDPDARYESFWVDAETVLDSEVVTSLADPETAEAFLNGTLDTTPAVPTVEAVDMPCREHVRDCFCLWCYRVSSNGFHMVNRGQCQCWNGCPCSEGSSRDR